MKKQIKRIFSLLMVLCMLFSMIPAALLTTSAAETNEVTNGAYTDGVWAEGGDGTATHTIDGTEVEVSKTAQVVEGAENTFDITLKVETSKSVSTKTDSAAIVLVIDVSGSMDFCSECGGDGSHDSDCDNYSFWNNSVSYNQSRMKAAKDQAKNFLNSYAGTDTSADRRIAIVKFQKSYSTVLGWTNVAGGEGENGYDDAIDAIDDLSANGGTNLEGGLFLADGLLNSNEINGITNKNVVLLTDGVPTYRINGGDGYNGSSQNNNAAKNRADSIKAVGAKIYTICFGVANERTYSGGPTVGDFLKESIATGSDYAYNADNALQLAEVFKAITEDIESGLDGDGWTVTDPMAENITVTGSVPAGFTTEDGSTYTWSLGTPEIKTEGNVTTYIYTITYRVVLSVKFDGFEENTFYPTNKETYLNIGEDSYAFPVPGVTGLMNYIDIDVAKDWQDNDDQDGIRPNDVTVMLYVNGESTGKTVVLSAGNGWKATFTDLPIYIGAADADYTVKEVAVAGYSDSVAGSIEDGFVITNSHTPETVTVAGTKTWKDNNNQDGVRPDSITVNLLANGKIIDSKTVTANDNWSWSFENLPKYENKGTLISYSVTEAAVEDYSAEYDGYDITNTHTPAQTSVTVSKSWQDKDDQDGIRPEDVTVKLLADGADTGKTVVLSEGNSWTASFTGLDKFSAGKEISYTVAEVEVAGYTTAISGDMAKGFVITNTHATETVTVAGSKTWKDNDNQDGARPDSITVNLVKNGEVIDSKVVTANDNWSWSFEGLDKYEDHGTLISYSITENAVRDYSTAYNGYNIINTHTPAQTSVTVSKAWEDNDDRDGIRPEDITVKLLADGKDTGKSVVLSEGNNWTASFVSLDKFSHQKLVSYTVAEISVANYNTVISGSMTDGYVITNSHTPATVDVSGSKTWDDNDNQDGIRPESITVNLLKNGKIIESKTVTANDNWSWSFKELPKFENHGTLINYSVTENVIDGYTAAYNGYNIKNSHTPEETSVTVSKSWQDKDDQDGIRPQDITVILLAFGNNTGKTAVLSEGNNWTASFTGLDKYSDGELIEYTVAEVKVAGYNSVINGNMTKGFSIVNTHTPETVDVKGEKTWDDANDQDGIRPESITVNLLANGKVINSKTVTANDNWSWSFEGLDKYEDHGNLINYTVTEDTINDYSTSYNGYNIKNSHTPAKTSVTVLKAWQDKDDQDGLRPEDITVHLYANGVDTGKTVVLSGGNNWTASFTDLDQYSEGKLIEYTVDEDRNENYNVVITGDMVNGYVLTNSHSPKTVDVEGSKTWDDNDNQDGKRPESITVNLLKNGNVIDTKTVTANDNWSWSFKGLDKYENHGSEITYTVSEAAVNGYTAAYNGFDITNTHTPDKVSFNVTKAWEDNDDQDGIRPEDITVKLLADGKDTGKSVVLSEGNKWSAGFENLDKYSKGKEIEYTLEEVKVDGYNSVIVGDSSTGFAITNSHNPEKTTVEGTKTWVDANNQDGKRLSAITVNLIANGKIIDTKVVTAQDNWSYTFENLDKYEDHGKLIIYSVTENTVEEYSTEYNGFDIINTHAPEKTSVTVSKSWKDKDDQDGLRPEDITVILLANGNNTGKTLVLSEGNKWTASFTDLDKYAAGQIIEYSVDEIKIDGYNTVISGNMNEGFVITNSHSPETVNVEGVKTWDDNDNQDGVRPERITVNLLKNGKLFESKTVTADDNWSWSFAGLDKYENHGTLINYSVTENAVEEYTTEYSGYDITNTHAPKKTSVTVSKVWEDKDDQDGIRPEDVTVILLSNGKNTGKSVTLSEGNGWTATFEDLDKFFFGKEIEYTVEEINVDGYNSVITGSKENGYVLTNSHTPETVTVAGTKTWNDNDNQDGFRPESITVNLLKNGQIFDSKTVTAEDNWSWSFENLDKYENHGTLINYSVTENAVEDYSTEYSGFDIINTHAPEKTSVTVSKAWQDKDDQDGIRPEDVTVILLSNGKNTDKSVVLSEGNNWTASFTDLDKYAAGEVIEYTVEEIKIDGYNTVISGDMADGFVITNSHTPETVTVAGAKTWDDNDNQDGKRPESITVNLIKNGNVADSVTVTAEDGWSWSFEGLDKYENHGTLITYSITEDAVEEYTTVYNGYDIINTHAPEKTSVTVSKAWEDKDDQDGIRPEDVTVKLLANGRNTGKSVVLSSGNNWTSSFTDLDKFSFGKEIEYTVEETEVAGYSSVVSGDIAEGFVVTNSHTPETVTVAGAKTWNDNDDQDGFRPESITVNLLKNGQIFDSKTVTAKDNWSWSFENLDKYENHGTLINYSVTENTVEEYSTEYSGFDIINTHAPEKTSVTVSKAWQDKNDQDGIRPNHITVKLLAGGNDTGKSVTLSDGNNWTASFENLDKYAAGEIIDYTVEEIKIDGYNSVITGSKENGFVITNSHTPETVTVEGAKTWDDNNNQDGKRPDSIRINLLKNGTVIDTKTVTANDNWSWSFEGLDKFENHGTLINYSITEDAVKEYTTNYSGYNVTNTHAPEKTSVTVSKSWKDNNDQDGLRPNDITVKLLANGKNTGKTLVLSNGNNWTASFTDLDKYSAGKVIAYTVEEIKVKEYSTVITGTQDKGFVITNSHTPETVDIKGGKNWNDADDQDGKRPDSITVKLLANGKEVALKTATANNGWEWTFEDLPKYENHGTLINYTVTEVAVDGYTTEYVGFNVTNTHTPEQTSVTVSKAWEDNDDQDGIRPESVTVKLLANGEETKHTIELSEKNNWTESFIGLHKYSKGQVITYTVQEVPVEGYESVISGDMTDGFVITNSHNPEKTEVKGVKTWDDNDDQDGARPESITVNLIKNGEIIDTATVTAENEWSYTFEGLDKYENHGEEIVYSITEEAVENYSVSYDGFDITNTHAPEKMSITVLKAWEDNNDEDGIRPDSVTVNLLANGEETGISIKLDASNNWTASFEDLDKFAEGKEIEYTVTENEVDGYKAVISGDSTEGFTVTNSHTPVPKTGDARNPLLYLALMLVSGGALTAIGFYSKKKKANG